ncbi:hypothetical protein SAMN04487938_2433 [Lysobacter sp. cf310]|nr:hypothetical protein SAMN04487938_2433 [Lysobacter sp. cf310]
MTNGSEKSIESHQVGGEISSEDMLDSHHPKPATIKAGNPVVMAKRRNLRSVIDAVVVQSSHVGVKTNATKHETAMIENVAIS